MDVINALRGKFKPLLGKTDRLDDQGHEALSSKPLALPIGTQRPPTLAEQVARLVRNERFNAAVAAQGYETFEEADDFDVEDDFDLADPSTPYEQDFDVAALRAVDQGLVLPPDEQTGREAQERIMKHPRKKKPTDFQEEKPKE